MSDDLRRALCTETIDATLLKIAAGGLGLPKEAAGAAELGMGLLRGAATTARRAFRGYGNALRGRVDVDPRLLRVTARTADGVPAPRAPRRVMNEADAMVGFADEKAAPAHLYDAVRKVRGGRRQDLADVAGRMNEIAGEGRNGVNASRLRRTAGALQREADAAKFRQAVAVGGTGYAGVQFVKGYSSPNQQRRGGGMAEYPYHGSQYG